MGAGKVISELFFPSDIKCIICGDDLPEKSRYGVCDRCKMSYNNKFCLRCGRAMKNMADYCDRCQSEAPPFDIARAPFVYEGDVRTLVHRMKFGSAKYLAPFMAQYMADCYFESGFRADLVTFVPMHPKRIKRRGYNQAEKIAAALSALIDVPLFPTLERIKATKELAKMKRKERAEEIEGAFALRESDRSVKGRNIVIVDDVFTSGATSGECVRALKKAKCGKVMVLTFATARIKPLLY